MCTAAAVIIGCAAGAGTGTGLFCFAAVRSAFPFAAGNTADICIAAWAAVWIAVTFLLAAP